MRLGVGTGGRWGAGDKWPLVPASSPAFRRKVKHVFVQESRGVCQSPERKKRVSRPKTNSTLLPISGLRGRAPMSGLTGGPECLS